MAQHHGSRKGYTVISEDSPTITSRMNGQHRHHGGSALEGRNQFLTADVRGKELRRSTSRPTPMPTNTLNNQRNLLQGILPRPSASRASPLQTRLWNTWANGQQQAMGLGPSTSRASPLQTIRRSRCPCFKLKCLQRARELGNKARAAREFECKGTNIRDWKKQISKLELLSKTCKICTSLGGLNTRKIASPRPSIVSPRARPIRIGSPGLVWNKMKPGSNIKRRKTFAKQPVIIEKKCQQCTRVFYGPRKRKCCSTECISKYSSSFRQMDKLQNYISGAGGKALLECVQCSRKAHAVTFLLRDKRFCNKTCQTDHEAQARPQQQAQPRLEGVQQNRIMITNVRSLSFVANKGGEAQREERDDIVASSNPQKNQEHRDACKVLTEGTSNLEVKQEHECPVHSLTLDAEPTSLSVSSHGSSTVPAQSTASEPSLGPVLGPSSVSRVITPSSAPSTSSGPALFPATSPAEQSKEQEANDATEWNLVDYKRKPAVEWTVDEVCEFLRGIPGCEGYVETFTEHEIDGEALLTLGEDQMINVMKMKLGKVAKIKNRAKQHRPQFKQEPGIDVIDLVD